MGDELQIGANLVFQNKGRRPIAVTSSVLIINHSLSPWAGYSEFIGRNWLIIERGYKGSFPNPYIIGSNNTEVMYMIFKIEQAQGGSVINSILHDFRNMTEYSFDIKLYSISGETFERTFEFKQV